MHRAVLLLLVLVAAAAMAPPAQPGRLSAVNPWLSVCELSEKDKPYGEHEHVCGDLPARERARILSTTYLRHCRERSFMSALSEGARDDALGGGAACLKAIGDLRAVDDIAAGASQDLNSILARYDCGQTFSVINKCADCQESYRRWVCSALLPLYVSGAVLRQGGAPEEGGSGGRGARSAAAPPPRLQPPPPSPPRKRSTSRDNYKLYASNNKNTKLKTNSDSYLIITNNNNKINNNNNNLIMNSHANVIINKHNNNNNNKDIGYNRVVNYDNVFDSLYRSSRDEYESVVDDTILLGLVDEETAAFYNTGDTRIIYGNASNNNNLGSDHLSGNISLTASSHVTEPPWNERGNTRSEQRAADVRKDLDNRLDSEKRRKRRRRNTTSAETGRYRLRPCLAVCQDVERTCPYFLPGDRAPSYPTQYAGEPTFLCLDSNIEETGEQLRKSNYGDKDCCYVYCGPRDNQICPRCRPNLSFPSQDQPYAPQCSSPLIVNSIVTTIPPTSSSSSSSSSSSNQHRTTSPNLVIVFFGLSVSCAHFLVTTNNLNNINTNKNKQSDTLLINNNNNNKSKNKTKDSLVPSCTHDNIIISKYYNCIYDFVFDDNNSIVWKCLKLMRIVECNRL